MSHWQRATECVLNPKKRDSKFQKNSNCYLSSLSLVWLWCIIIIIFLIYRLNYYVFKTILIEVQVKIVFSSQMLFFVLFSYGFEKCFQQKPFSTKYYIFLTPWISNLNPPCLVKGQNIQYFNIQYPEYYWLSNMVMKVCKGVFNDIISWFMFFFQHHSCTTCTSFDWFDEQTIK